MTTRTQTARNGGGVHGYAVRVERTRREIMNTVFANYATNTEARAQYSRRKLVRDACGRLVYEPRMSIEPFTDSMYRTSYALRINGNLSGTAHYRNRADAVTELRRLARVWWRGEAGTDPKGLPF